MKSPWPEVELSKVIKPVQRIEETVHGKKYRQIGVRLWGRGAYERATIDGADTKYKTLLLMCEGDIVVNKIWARNGSVAVVTKGLSETYGSSEFPTFQPNRDLLEPCWFHWITKKEWFWKRCELKSRGSSGKNRIRPESFLEIKVPLPPIEEQQSIVGIIEHIATKIEKAGKLQNIIDHSQEELLHSIYETTTKAMCKEITLRDILIQNKHQIAIEDEQEYKQVTVAMHGKGVRLRKRINGSDIKTKNQYLIRSGQFIYSRIDARNGAIGIVPKELDGAIVTGDFPTFNINQEIILPEILEIIIISKNFVDACRLASRGVTNRRRLKEDHFLSIKTFIPYPEEQQKIVALKKRVDAMKRVQSQTAAELETFIPAVLDRAFKGEL